MAIIAIEGPDKCGKSTMFEALHGLTWPKQPQFVEPVSYGKERMHVASELSLRELEMWEALYRPDTLYISNRHVLVTEPVYSWLYGRKMLRNSWLSIHMFVVYIEVPVAELQRRHRECNERIQDIDTYDRVCDIYRQVVERFPCRTYAAPETSAAELQQRIFRYLEVIRG